MMGMGGSGQVHGWRLAVDGRTNCLVVRGSEHDLQMASDLVAMLDLPEGKPMPRLKNIRAFKLKFADPEQVAMMLQALEINATIAPAPKATLLIVSGSEAAMKEVAEVIEAVDVQGKPATGTPGGKGGGTGNPP
jgi:type II secretory pathway component GspD/PulD (secretin)